jgi:hypothetical protein
MKKIVPVDDFLSGVTGEIVDSLLEENNGNYLSGGGDGPISEPSIKDKRDVPIVDCSLPTIIRPSYRLLLTNVQSCIFFLKPISDK